MITVIAHFQNDERLEPRPARSVGVAEERIIVLCEQDWGQISAFRARRGEKAHILISRRQARWLRRRIQLASLRLRRVSGKRWGETSAGLTDEERDGDVQQKIVEEERVPG